LRESFSHLPGVNLAQNRFLLTLRLGVFARIILPQPTSDGVQESSEHWPLLHVIRVEELPFEAAQSGSNGSG
jgi:hypothetical protein